jgi:hypothetical protein
MLVERVHVITDEHDTPACARWFGRWHDLDHGRITVRVTPPATKGSPPRDILRSLGKRLSLPESPGQNADVWPLVALWLAAEQVRDVFVLRAHLLDEQALAALLVACDAAQAAPWLIVAGPQPPDAMMAVLDRLLVNPLGESGACSRVRLFEQTETNEGGPPPRRGAPRSRAWPALPDDEFWSFRSASEQLLSDGDFERVDAELLVGRMIALEWIERRTRQHWARSRPLNADEMHGLLAGIHAAATCRSQALVRLRGAQTALFLAGAHRRWHRDRWLLVRIPADALAAATAAAAAPLDRHTAALLRGFASPRIAAAGALAFASGQPAWRLRSLDLHSLSDDAGEVALDGRCYAIPYYARGLLRAQRDARENEGAHEADPIFRGPTGPPQRISVRALQKILARVAATTGLAVNADPAHHGLRAPRWPLEDHVSIGLLDPGRPR